MNCVLALGFAGMIVAAGLVVYLFVNWVHKQLDFADTLFDDGEDWL